MRHDTDISRPAKRTDTSPARPAATALPGAEPVVAPVFTAACATTFSLLLALLLPMVLTLAGCGGADPEQPYRQYLSRLQNTLGVEAPAQAALRAPRPPRSGALRLALASSNLGALDFLALSGCALQVNIGRRNSSLGRLAHESQRLLLDLEYLRLAPACAEKLRAAGRAELATKLDDAWARKRQQLPAQIFNATLGGNEFRALWLPDRRAGDYPAQGDGTAGAALAAIDALAQRWLAGDYRADNFEFEIFLGEVAGGGAGALLRDLLAQQAWLARADATVQARMRKGPLCAPGIRHRAADILPNVVRRFFIEGIQPRAARMGSRTYQLLPPLQALEQRLDTVLPPPYRQWMAQRDALLEAALAAPRGHVERLQAIGAPCGEHALRG